MCVAGCGGAEPDYSDFYNPPGKEDPGKDPPVDPPVDPPIDPPTEPETYVLKGAFR